GVLELIAAVAGKDEADTERAGSLAERSNLITRGCCDDEDPLHTSRMSSGDGSAQQYQFSESIGIVRCGERFLWRGDSVPSARSRIAANVSARDARGSFPTRCMTRCCSASTRESVCRQGQVSDAG